MQENLFLYARLSLQVAGLLLKMLKYFKVMLNFLEFSHVKEITES